MILPPQPGFTFVPLTAAERAQFAEFGQQFVIYDVALNVGDAIDSERLEALVARGDISIFRMVGEQTGRSAYALRSRYAMAEQIYVFCPEQWDNTAVAAGMEALTTAIFAESPECEDIWTCLPLPLPADAEETLLIMGFTYTMSSLDRGRRRTYGLSREVFAAYHED